MTTLWFDDYSVGLNVEVGAYEMTAGEMLAFASQFDPQPFHVDPDAAAESIYGGLIASGWHTGSVTMRLLADHVLGPASMGSPGLDELRWQAPVRAGDVLALHFVVMELLPSRSKPDRGIVKASLSLVNQDDVVVCSMVANLMMKRQPSSG